MEVFDRSNGQVYSETISSQVKSMGPTLNQKTRGMRKQINPAKHKSPPGCASLKDMALRSCTWNIDSFLPETLQDVEWHHASMIYKGLKDGRNLSLNAWIMFHQAFPEQVGREKDFYFTEPDAGPRRPEELPYLAKMSAKLNPGSLTHLYLSNLVISFGDLMTLTGMPTLAGLAIDLGRVSPEQRMTDLQIRDWGRAVQEKQSFQKLEVLILSDIGPNTSDILRRVSSFPSLHLACILHSGYRSIEKHTDNIQQIQWQRMLFNSDEENKDHRLFWADNSLSLMRLKSLRKISRRRAEQSARDETNEASLFLDYRVDHRPERRERYFQSLPRCYLRLPNKEAPLERGIITESRSRERDIQGRSNKKRKIREEKQTDLGSLLGSFA